MANMGGGLTNGQMPGMANMCLMRLKNKMDDGLVHGGTNSTYKRKIPYSEGVQAMGAGWCKTSTALHSTSKWLITMRKK
jgi:hypothetical protein